MAKLLEVKNLNVSFKIDAGKVLAVNGVSFSLDEGKVLGIVGESGSGKSVTAYSIMQILDKNGHIDEGKIIYKGTDLLRIGEEEKRYIRGNKISIIFQDAMTSLNPVWTIGNQLAESILTHAKDPIKEYIYQYENEITSDLQRIASMEKGIRNHPEREILYTDKAKVEAKLVEDRKALEQAKLDAAAKLADAKTKAKETYKQGLPAYEKVIKEKKKEYHIHYKELAPKPEKDAIKNDKYLAEINGEIVQKQKELEYLKQDYQTFVEHNDLDIARLENKARIDGIRKVEKEIRKLQRKLKFYTKNYEYVVVHEPRKQRHIAIKQAIQAKKDFYWECKSSYIETKYSAYKKALAMLKEVGITDPEKRMQQYPFELSGGMLQRAMIAMALVQKPDILIADEPTTALDVTIQAQILELLKRLQKEYGMAIIIITHDLGVIAQICDEVDVMYAGRIIERGTVDDIFYNPQHEYTKGLLNSMPKLDETRERLDSIAGNPVDLFCLPKGCAFSSRCSKCMDICIEKYPEEILYDETGHAASCWAMIKKLHKEGKIDIENGTPEGKPLKYNGAVIFEGKGGK